jgi:hypothetical protein
MSGVGKTTAARTVARRYDLWFYSVDARAYAHAEAMRSPALGMSVDELWVDRTSEQMAEDFEREARKRFGFVLLDVGGIPDDGAPVLAEGPQLLPDLVGTRSVFIAAHPDLQRELVSARGSPTFSATRDPEQALANRLRRDELLARRLGSAAEVVEIADVQETETVVEDFVRAYTRAWVAHGDLGDVAARRRDDNERRLDQWSRYSAHEPDARKGTVDFTCECDRSGCTEVVQRGFEEASGRPRLAH